MTKDSSKDVLSAINKKTGKNISSAAVQKIASKVGPSTMSSDVELRKLIKQVANMAKIKVTDNTMEDIVKAVKASGMNTSNMESLIKMMLKN